MQVTVVSRKTYEKKETIFMPFITDFKEILKKFNDTDAQFIESYIKETDFKKKDKALIKIPEMGNSLLLCGLSESNESIASSVRKYQDRIETLVFDIELFRPLGMNEEMLINEIARSCILGTYSGTNIDKMFEPRMKNAIILVPEDKLQNARDLLLKAVENTNTTLNARKFSNNDYYSKPLDFVIEKLKKDITKKLKVKISRLKDIKGMRCNGLASIADFSSEEPAILVAEHKPEKGKTIVLSSALLLTPDFGDSETSNASNLSAGIIRSIMKNYSYYEKNHHVVIILTIAKLQKPEDMFGKTIRLASGSSYNIDSKQGIVNVLLADAIYQASKYKPRQIVSFYANSTGFSSFLGRKIAGYISNSESLNKKITEASLITLEDSWRLPLIYHKDVLERKTYFIAKEDMNGSWLNNARILEGNASGYPWLHLDFSSFSFSDRNYGLESLGSSGFGAALLNQYLSLVFEAK